MMEPMYRVERFDPEGGRRFGGADAFMVDFEEGWALVPVEVWEEGIVCDSNGFIDDTHCLSHQNPEDCGGYRRAVVVVVDDVK